MGRGLAGRRTDPRLTPIRDSSAARRLKCRISNGKRRSVPDATCPTTGTEQDNRRKNSSSPFADNYPPPAHNHTIGDFPGTQRSKILSFPGNRPYSGFDSAPDRNMDAKGHFSLRGPGDNRGPQGAVLASWGDRQVFVPEVEENATRMNFKSQHLNRNRSRIAS